MSKGILKNKKIVVVDNVMTVGSIVNEVAKCVRAAGVKSEAVWCMAHVD